MTPDVSSQSDDLCTHFMKKVAYGCTSEEVAYLCCLINKKPARGLLQGALYAPHYCILVWDVFVEHFAEKNNIFLFFVRSY